MRLIMIKSWSDEAWEEFEYWAKNDKKIFKRILELIKDIDKRSFQPILSKLGEKYNLKIIKKYSKKNRAWKK